MNKNQEDDYKVCIWGTTVSKVEANRIGLAIIIGFVGAALSILIIGPQEKMVAFFICLLLAAFGYFGIAKKIFKDKNKT